MKQFVVAAALALLLVACSDKPAPEAVQPSVQTLEPAGKQAAPASKDRKLKEALPEGVEIGFRYHLISDRVVSPEGKGPRRRIVMEYLESDQAQIFENVGNSLKNAGFALRDRKDVENGNIRAKFGKAKFGVVIVTVTPPAPKHRHPEAIGRVVLDWPAREEDVPARGADKTDDAAATAPEEN